VIDRATRDCLILEDRKSADLIKPFLRGRDVKRWVVNHQDLYLIVFPFGFHKKLKEYPAILRHLSQYEDKLKKRGQCTSSRGNKEGGQHHWLELDKEKLGQVLLLYKGLDVSAVVAVSCLSWHGLFESSERAVGTI
jgi:hypothetical protein